MNGNGCGWGGFDKLSTVNVLFWSILICLGWSNCDIQKFDIEGLTGKF